MLRIRPFHLVATGLLLLGAPPSTTLAQDDVSRSATADCDPRQLRAFAARQTVANLVGCQYETVRAFLPPFVTVDWVSLDGAPAGRVLRQSASRGTPYSQLESRFALTVSTGPGVSIATPTAVDGGTLSFRMQSPVRPASPYGVEYSIALDPSGRSRAGEGTHYVSASDNNFLQGGTLDIRTRLGSGVERLHVIIMLTFPPDGPAASSVLGSGVGRIVPYPRVSVLAPSAREGAMLTFVARIDRSGLPHEAFSYRFELQGNAERGVDYVAPPTALLTFAPGEEVAALSIRTLDNGASFEDRSLVLSIAVPAQQPVLARGTILNTTVRPPDDVEDDDVEGNEAENPAPGPEEAATPEGDSREPQPGSGADPAGDGEGLWQSLMDWGLGWLAAIGAIAVGLLAGFLFGAKSQKPGTVAKDGDEETAPEPGPPGAAPMPVIGWTTSTPGTPAVKGGSIPIDGPSITIQVDLGEGRAGRLESVPILSEGPSDE